MKPSVAHLVLTRLVLGCSLLLACFTTHAAAARIQPRAVGTLPRSGEFITGGCPSGEQSLVTQNNTVFSICPNADYDIPSINMQTVANPRACAELCNTTQNCKFSVWQPGNNVCHLKATTNAPRWRVNNNYWTVTQVTQLQRDQFINGNCPFNSTALLVGNDVWNICPWSDYTVGTPQLVNAATPTACVNLCAAAQGCRYSVFDPNRLCHLKGTPNPLKWRVSNYFTTGYQLYTLNRGQRLTNGCLGGQTRLTTSNGAVFTSCPFSDFQLGDIAGQSLYDDQSCAEFCSRTQGCRVAVFDTVSGWCHLKGNPSLGLMVSSDRYRAIYVSDGSSSGGGSTGGATPGYTPTNGAAITGNCPNAGTTYTARNNVTFNVCPQSDYATYGIALVGQADRASCIEWCSNTPGCFYGVWDRVLKNCLSKGSPYTLNWQQSDRFESFAMNSAGLSAPATVTKNGRWSNVIGLRVNPVAAYLVPRYPSVTRFLAFSSWSPKTFGGAPQYQTAFVNYDFSTNSQSDFMVSNTMHDMFCPGMNALADGRLVIDGGNTDAAVTIYNPFTNSWSRAANMTRGRGYQTSVTLSDGLTFTIGGSFTGGIGGQNGVPMKDGEVYDSSTNRWTALPGATVRQMLTTYDGEGAWRTDNHGWLFAWTGGSVLQAGPSKQMNWYSTSGSGGVTAAGIRNNNNDQMNGISVMVDASRGIILTAGGAQSYTESQGLNVAHQITITGVNQAPTVQQVGNMNYGRGYANAIVLPNGQVFVTGGQMFARVFQDSDSVLQSEIWDPTTRTFTAVAAASVPRNYHSTTLLLPDGRVMSGGGGLCYLGGPCQNNNHEDMQFYSPPYLFNSNGGAATRPTVSSLRSSQQSGSSIRVNPGGTLTVTLGSASGLSHVLVRLGSSTHSIDSDQRRVPLTVSSTSGNTVTLSIPGDNGIVPPGFYYYFAVASSGVHSLGLTVNVLKR